MRYAVVLERGGKSVGAWVPDLPGCVAVGESESESLRLIQEAIELHVRELRVGGDPVPDASTMVTFVDIA